MDACQVSISAGTAEEASVIADSLLDAHLAACVQIVGPLESRYWWQGAREQASEWLCLAKSRTTLVDEIVRTVRAVHSYATPEILAVPVVGGDASYLAWLEQETSRRGDT